MDMTNSDTMLSHTVSNPGFPCSKAKNASAKAICECAGNKHIHMTTTTTTTPQ